MQKKAKQYSAEEKTKIVLETLKGELSMAQISSKYGIHTTQITSWKKQGLELLIQGFKNKVKTGDPNQEYKELIKSLYQDRKSTRLNSSHTDISRMPSSA